jgi:hypothetical protein
MKSPCCLCIPQIFARRFTKSTCCQCIFLIFARRLMKSPCCLCIPQIFARRFTKSTCCQCIFLIFARRLMKSPCCLCVRVSPQFRRFLCVLCRIKGKKAISTSQNMYVYSILYTTVTTHGYRACNKM